MTTLAIGFSGLCLAIWFFVQSREHKMAQLTAQQSTVLEKMRYDTVAKNSPLTTISAVDLQAALALNKTIAAYPKTPCGLITKLCRKIAR
jgi:hypothetical protein